MDAPHNVTITGNLLACGVYRNTANSSQTKIGYKSM